MHTDQILDITALEGSLPDLAERYASARPYPHVVLDGVLRPEVLAQAYDELAAVPAEDWTNYLHLNERKFANTKPHTWGPTLQSIADGLNSERFVRFLADLTGFEGLQADPSLDGGGLHRCVAGGFLNVHADFTAHHVEHRWQRRVNLLLYLNPEWQPEWGGDLELWTSDMARCEATVAPVGNRVLIFTTTERSYHGHPEPLRAPPGVARQSLALYYFTQEDRIRPRSTDYRARPDDGWAGSAGIYLDKLALRAYDIVKRRRQLSDTSASRWLGALNRAAARARARRSRNGPADP
ncbi:MAG: 2OG-Fe(II) oxygenase [Acidimicrobiales bacterium]|nr:2OG-Fe(II) oxygenase [Acidimicrobiales bacterium]